MKVIVKLFAVLRDRAGMSSVELELPPGTTVGRAAEIVMGRLPVLKGAARIAFAVNRTVADSSIELHEGDELALLPPVSGGCDGAVDSIALLSDPLPIEKALRDVVDGEAGGIDVFIGTTRAERGDGGKRLVALDYEAYSEMAIGQLRDLARRAREQWPIRKLVVQHRVGRVLVGEASVLIAVACPHRAEAFEACRWLIDTLKAEAAIWKKEIWSEGEGRWVEG